MDGRLTGVLCSYKRPHHPSVERVITGHLSFVILIGEFGRTHVCVYVWLLLLLLLLLLLCVYVGDDEKVGMAGGR